MGLIVCWVQLRVSNWFTDQVREPSKVDLPELAPLINQILLEEQWESTMPEKYCIRLPYQGLAGPAPAPAPTPVAPPCREPPGSGAPPPPGRANGQGERVVNAELDRRYQPFRNLGLNLLTVRNKAIAANKPV